MSGSSNNLNIFRNPSSAVHNAYLVKLSPEIVEQLKQEARTVVDLDGCTCNHSTAKGPQLVITEQGKYFGLRLDQNRVIKLKYVPEGNSDIEFYESERVQDDGQSLVLSGRVKGKLFEEKQLSNKISEYMKKRVLEAEKEAHAHDIKVIQPLENKRKNGVLKQTFVGSKRRVSLPPVLKKTSSENQLRDSNVSNRTVLNQNVSEHLQDASAKKHNPLPIYTHTDPSVSKGYRVSGSSHRTQANAMNLKDRPIHSRRLESSKEFTSHYSTSEDTGKKTMSLQTFLMYMLLLGPMSTEELERERRDRFLRFELDTSLSMDTVLEEVAVLQDGKWKLKEDKMTSLVFNEFPLYSEEESKRAEKILQRWKYQRKLCSEEEINAALEAFQRESNSVNERKEDVVENDCKNISEYSPDEILNEYIEKYRLYHSLVSRLSELSKSFEDLRNRFLNSSSAEERQKLRERIKILRDKHGSKWDIGFRLIKNLESQLKHYKNKLWSP
ncbi:hypothetical protein GpartN1_g1178.t1 [Galdieria partita]|uniref:Uncharacterized protein n=1 Tax=Galdieria partita TaxID=83374 RepID=A0A9C7PTF6_9RHOD|nr:hypothetical protein GpartN1_g1178.t1 [Galdieria partita]